MKTLKCLLLVYLSVFSFTSFGQNTEAIPFAPQILAKDGVFGLTVSPDGSTALWVLSKGKRDTLIIQESRYHQGQWSSPVTATFSSAGEFKDIDPVFTPDGNRILFQSTRPVPGLPERKGFDIWAVDRIGNRWSEPFHLGNSINTDVSESFASATTSGDIYFMKENSDGISKSDLFVSYYHNGEYSTPENLGNPVNTTERESNPFIAPDGKYLIYFSSDSSGYGDVDLFITFRTAKGWSAPVNLGPDINTADAEFCPFYHTGQRRLYFARQRKTEERLYENVFSIPFDPASYQKK